MRFIGTLCAPHLQRLRVLLVLAITCSFAAATTQVDIRLRQATQPEEYITSQLKEQRQKREQRRKLMRRGLWVGIKKALEEKEYDGEKHAKVVALVDEILDEEPSVETLKASSSGKHSHSHSSHGHSHSHSHHSHKSHKRAKGMGGKRMHVKKLGSSSSGKKKGKSSHKHSRML